MSTRPLRQDARRNRDALVAAAREVFGGKGIEAPLDEVARTAKVAIGTLYNRFPTRADLVEAAFLPMIEESLAHTEEALACEDPWDGFVLFLERAIQLQVTDRGFTEVCNRTFAPESNLETTKQVVGERMAQIVARAQDSGQLREDFRVTDLGAVFGAALAGPDWRRGLMLILDGLRTRERSGRF